MIRFEQLSQDEGPRLRSIRLRALQDAPDAFGTTFEQASANFDEVWARQVVELPTFVAVENGQDVAMVRCARDQPQRRYGLASLYVGGTRVPPSARWRRAGRPCADLARANDISRLLMDVADLNAPAIALYEAKGFMPNGKSGSMPSPRQHILEHQRELRLA
jgi:hypothetical protein